ncbi:restriction endonuclease subunit S [Peribacillus simplex]|uniref:restriction endonuclease subunit S n=1 Tax=Peribacillus simplex TaxID=1478 RepID=UPI0034E88ECB
MNAPKLRFKGFNLEWHAETLEKYLTFNNGINAEKGSYGHGRKFINVLDVLNNNSITYDKIIGSVSVSPKIEESNKVEYGDILFLRSSETREDVGKSSVYLDKEEHALFGGFVIRGKKQCEYNPYFLKLNLESPNVRKQIGSKAGGSTRFNVSQSILSSVELNMPSIDEQILIAEFFEKLDTKIQKQQEKIELLNTQKKGLMQKIFSQEFRFKDGNGQEYPEWTYKRLKELVTPIKGNSVEDVSITSIPVLSISAKVGFLDQKDRFSQVIAGNSLSKYTALRKYDLSYNKGNSKAAKYGCVYMLDAYEEALVPNVYKSFRTKTNVDPLYLQYYFSSKLPDKELKKIISSTARMDGLLNVSDSDFYNIPILSPNLDEQIKISSFLLNLEKKIRKEEDKLSILSGQKNGLMQQMFI